MINSLQFNCNKNKNKKQKKICEYANTRATNTEEAKHSQTDKTEMTTKQKHKKKQHPKDSKYHTK